MQGKQENFPKHALSPPCTRKSRASYIIQHISGIEKSLTQDFLLNYISGEDTVFSKM